MTMQMGGAGSAISLATPLAGATTLTGRAPAYAVVPVYKGNASIGPAFADSVGVWALALGAAVAAGDVFRTPGGGAVGVAPLTIGGAPGRATPGVAFSFVPNIAGGLAPYAVRYSVEAGQTGRPAAWDFVAATGETRGITAQEGVFTWRETVSDASGQSAALDVSVTVAASAVVVAFSPKAVQLGHSQIQRASYNQTGIPGTPANGSTNAHSQLAQFSRLTRGRILDLVGGQFGLGGDTISASSGNPGVLSRVDACIAAAKQLGAGIVFLDGLGNSIGATRPTPGADGTTAFSAANIREDFLQVCQKFRNENIVVAAMNFHPRGNAAGTINGLAGANLATFIDSQAAIQALDDGSLGRNIFNPIPYLVDDVRNYSIQARYSDDFLHYNGLATTTLAPPWAEWALARGFLPDSALVIPGATALAGALNTNPNMDNTGGQPTGYSAPASGNGLTVALSYWTDPNTGLRWVRLDFVGTPTADLALAFRQVCAVPATRTAVNISGLCEYMVPAGRATGLGGISLSVRTGWTATANTANPNAWTPVAGQALVASDRFGGADTKDVRGVILTEPMVLLPPDAAQAPITAFTSLQVQNLLYFKNGVAADASVLLRGHDVRFDRSLQLAA